MTSIYKSQSHIVHILLGHNYFKHILIYTDVVKYLP
jgi:hypothetical protein